MWPNPSLTRGLTRAVVIRCPRCGSGHLFRRWVTMEDECPRCGLHFEREEGYWLGSVMINTGATEGLFLVVFVLGMVLTWPDVPWTALLVIGVALTLLFPILFHPVSRTTWIALERHVRKWSETELPLRPRPGSMGSTTRNPSRSE